MNATSAAHGLLTCATPQAWIASVVPNLHVLLLDHANCEKKAAATAFKLMFSYGDHYPELQEPLSKLAREELRHFEQVMRLLRKRGIKVRPLSASRYAAGLRRHLRKHEPERLVDLLVINAFIEARSCERFAVLAPILDAELAGLYRGLAVSESRHLSVYLKLAAHIGDDSIPARLRLFAEVEATLINCADTEYRFHSGPVQGM